MTNEIVTEERAQRIAERFDEHEKRLVAVEEKINSTRSLLSGFAFGVLIFFAVVFLSRFANAATNSTVSGVGQTLALNGTNCVSFEVNGSVVGTACGTDPAEPGTVNFAYGGNLVSPFVSTTVYGVTVNAPAFPAFNRLVLLRSGESFVPDDARFNLNVTCASPAASPTATPQTCRVDAELAAGEVSENRTAPCDVRVKAKDAAPVERVDITKSIKPGENFTLATKFVSNLALDCVGEAAAVNTTANATQTMLCPVGWFFNLPSNSCVQSTPTNQPAQGAPGQNADWGIYLMLGIMVFCSLVMAVAVAWRAASGNSRAPARSAQIPLTTSELPTKTKQENE